MKPLLNKIILHTAITLALALSATRRLLSEHSFVFFAWYYFGIRLALHQEIWAHKLLKSQQYLKLAPRNHGKTELASKILLLWRICRNRDIRILMVTKSADLARKNAMVVREELVSNQKLIRDFGKFYDPKVCREWTQSKFQVVRSKNMKDPTLEAIGLNGTITGGRCDLMIFDDIIDEDSVTTPEMMEKVHTRVTGTFLPLLEPTGQVWVIGTRKSYGDLYHSLMNNPLWQYSIDKAIIREPSDWDLVQLDEPWIDENGFEHYEKVVIRGKDRGVCLWPEFRKMEWLLRKKLEWGSVIFSREMQNEVVDDETALFKLSWLEQCRDENLSYVIGNISEERLKSYEVVITGVDPSLVTDAKHAKATDSDYMVLIAIGLQKDGTRDLLALDRARGLSPDAVNKRISSFHSRVPAFKMAIEENAFGLIYIEGLIKNTDLPILKHRTGNNKNDAYQGVPHLSPLFENRKFRLPYKTDEDKVITDKLIHEIHSFGSNVHDDQVMALWIGCYNILRWLAGQARKRRRDQQSVVERR